MKQRPLCVFCLAFLLLLLILDLSGIPLIRGNPLPEQIQRYMEGQEKILVSGIVTDISSSENGISMILSDALLHPDPSSPSSKVPSSSYPIYNLRVFLSNRETISIGDTLLVHGHPERVPEPRNPGEFDSRQYYACEHIYYFLKKAGIEKQLSAPFSLKKELHILRNRFYSALTAAAGEDAGVFGAVVLGDKTGLSQEKKLLYQMAGIIHILAVSGLHISILGMGIFRLLCRTRLGMILSALLSLVIMLLFCIMTGSSISTLRAVIMFAAACAARITGRDYDPATALAAAAALLAAESPARLYSASFLLSFGAVSGILLLHPILTCRLPEAGSCPGLFSRSVNWLLISLSGSLSVILMTLPVSLYFYGEIALAGILLNLIVIPSAGIVLATGAAAALMGAPPSDFCRNCSRVLILPGRMILRIYERLCRWMSELPWCTWTGGRPAVWQILLYYGILLSFILYADRHFSDNNTGKHPRKRWFCRLAAAGLILSGILILGYHPVRGLRITCLDVGQGDGIVVQSQEGYAFLVDGGSTSKNQTGTFQLLPFLKSQGIGRLDGILISHTDEDHINGVTEMLTLRKAGLSPVSVDTLYMPDWKMLPDAWKQLAELAEDCGTKVVRLSEGSRLTCGEMILEAKAPEKNAAGEDVNEDCMVLLLTYRDFSALFTGDIGEETERKLLPSLAQVDFLKVGHHGSRHSSCEDFLKAIRPEIGVISCSESNRYGHPSPEAVERLERNGVFLAYTMKSGAVTLETDGRQVSVHGYIN